jgi:hypothetical protein
MGNEMELTNSIKTQCLMLDGCRYVLTGLEQDVIAVLKRLDDLGLGGGWRREGKTIDCFVSDSDNIVHYSETQRTLSIHLHEWPLQLALQDQGQIMGCPVTKTASRTGAQNWSFSLGVFSIGMAVSPAGDAIGLIHFSKK